MRTVYDLLVIGAGPAGSACARRAAGLGLECLVLERSFFPRTKPCAGGLTSNAVSRLDPEASALFRIFNTFYQIRDSFFLFQLKCKTVFLIQFGKAGMPFQGRLFSLLLFL